MYVVPSDFSAAFSRRNLKVFFFKLVNMAYEEASLMKSNKEELIGMTLNYQGKSNGVSDDLKGKISGLKNDPGLKSDFSKLEADKQVTRNANTNLSKRIVTMERRYYANEQYSRRECLEILGVPASVADNGLESKVFIKLNVVRTFVESC